MAVDVYICSDKEGNEFMFDSKPFRLEDTWKSDGVNIPLPFGSIYKLLGYYLSWTDEPYKLI